MANDKQVSAGIAAICTLLKYLEHDKCKLKIKIEICYFSYGILWLIIWVVTAETIQELVTKLKRAVKIMRSTDCPITAVVSGSELFLRFITLATLDYSASEY